MSTRDLSVATCGYPATWRDRAPSGKPARDGSRTHFQAGLHSSHVEDCSQKKQVQKMASAWRSMQDALVFDGPWTSDCYCSQKRIWVSQRSTSRDHSPNARTATAKCRSSRSRQNSQRATCDIHKSLMHSYHSSSYATVPRRHEADPLGP